MEMKELLNFGVINFDKCTGPTSYSVSEFVKWQLKLKKTSHMGTLDPKVTGVLPVLLGRACKLAGYFISSEKTYVGVLETHKDCSMEELQKLIDENFTGKILQTPPHRSAVKQAERERTVFYWKLLEESDKRFFLFEAKVEGGTYIRKLCSDLGEMIGGAHMGELRRTQAGIFSEEDNLVKLEDFEDAVKKWKDGDESELRGMVVDAREAIRKVLPVVEIDKSALRALFIGKPLLASNVVGGGEDLKKDEVFAAFSGERFVGVYRVTGDEKFFARSEFVCN
jgi:H/ACA ribonucleoprotein complex subunit 4